MAVYRSILGSPEVLMQTASRCLCAPFILSKVFRSYPGRLLCQRSLRAQVAPGAAGRRGRRDLVDPCRCVNLREDERVAVRGRENGAAPGVSPHTCVRADMAAFRIRGAKSMSAFCSRSGETTVNRRAVPVRPSAGRRATSE